MTFSPTILALLISGFFSISVFANFDTKADQINQAFPLNSLTEATQKRVDYIIERHRKKYKVGERCPLASVKNADILAKITALKGVFEQDCAAVDRNRLDQIMVDAEALQTNLNQASTDSGSTFQLNASSTLATSSNGLDGQKVQDIFKSINTAFSTGKCKRGGNFLEQSADVIQNFSQMGMLVPNSSGVVIAGGGFALASIIRFINSLFKKRFDFDDPASRQSFVKLNCSFYDIRRNIDSAGFMVVANEAHYKDFAETKGLEKELENKLKELNKNAAERLKGIDALRDVKISAELGLLDKLQKTVAKALVATKVKIADDAASPALTKKMQMIQAVSLQIDALNNGLKEYIRLELSRQPIMDELLISQLQAFDSAKYRARYLKLVKMKIERFESEIRGNLLYHFGRISLDLEKKKGEIAKNFDKTALVKGQKFAAYRKQVIENSAKIIKKAQTDLNNIKVSHSRLKNITEGDKGYVRSDDGSSNVRSILEIYKDIAEKIYGKFGFEFLDHVTTRGIEQNKIFNRKYRTFQDAYLIKETGSDGKPSYSIPPKPERGDLPYDEYLRRAQYPCQDVMPFRAAWKEADSIVQEGYDFVATNQKLFHADVPKTMIKKRSRKTWRRIQDHGKSALFAKEIIRGGKLSQKVLGRYFGRDPFLGKAMLEVNNSKNNAGVIQAMIEQYHCDEPLAN